MNQLYNSWIRRLDVRQVLEYYGARNISEVPSSDGTTELVHSCLLDRVEPHHSHGDDHPSASANVEKGLYCCYTYWAGDILHLVMKLEGRDSVDAILPIIGDFLTGATRDGADRRREIDQLIAAGQVYSIDLPSYSEKVLDPWRFTHPWMREVRGVTQQAHELLGIGFDERENRIVFPHWWNGRLVGWQKRAIPERQRWVDDQTGWPGTCPQWPKYRSSCGFPKSETLYAYDLARHGLPGEVVVVESPMSVAKAYSLGLFNIVATFGAKVSQHQIDLLKNFKRVVVWFDADAAGGAGERKVVENLYRHATVTVVTPDEGIDLGDLDTADQVYEKIDSAQTAAFKLAQWDREIIHGTQTQG